MTRRDLQNEMKKQSRPWCIGKAFDHSAPIGPITRAKDVQAIEQEAQRRGVNYKSAWDDVNWVDLDTDEDFLEKAQAIFQGEDYDTRVQVPLELDDATLFQLMKLAHESDVTLNQKVEEILRDVIERNNNTIDW
jgi:hypothetical protein